MMPTLQQIKDRIAATFPGAQVEIIPNGSPANQPSLLLEHGRALEIARFLRDAPELRFDYASNVTGVDWPEKTVKEKVKVRKIIDGVEKETEVLAERKTPAFLEAVYHLYSMDLGHGPLILRLRTGNRTDRVTLPSLTPVWRSCEFQEREIFDLFGIQFQGHPDLRRILMWDNFADHPMRKDYAPPAHGEAAP
jgi:NADH-quinone oxidoreductase subunit C